MAIRDTTKAERFPTGDFMEWVVADLRERVNNLLGRTGMALAPMVVGAWSSWLGTVGQAVAVVALVPFLCLPIILVLVAETRGQELEHIEP